MKGGLNVPLHGSVNNFNIDSIDTKFSAVLSDDYFGLKPKILIREGDTVNQGDPLFEDKTNPGLDLFYLQKEDHLGCLLYTSPSPRDQRGSRMPSSA